MATSEPKRRGRPPKVMAQPTDRLAKLTDREKALAVRVRARHRYTFDMPLDLYESLLDQAESWDQPLPDIVRACLRKGLDHIKQFGAGDHNPWLAGRLNPPAQHDVDPTGTAWPPTNTPAHWAPQWTAPPLPATRTDYPPPMVIAPNKSLAGLLPSGSTPMASMDEPLKFNPNNLPKEVRDMLEEGDLNDPI